MASEKLYFKKFKVKWDWEFDFQELVEEVGGFHTGLKYLKEGKEVLYQVTGTEKQLKKIMIRSMAMCN